MSANLLMSKCPDEGISSSAVGYDRMIFDPISAGLQESGIASFLADLTHEIRTPISAIIGLGNILLSTELDDKQRQCVGVLQSSAEVLLAMVSRTLDVSKREALETGPENTSFDMAALLEQIKNIMSIKAQEKNIGLVLHYGIGTQKIFVGDSGYIRQIVTNLVGNAIKFTEFGGVSISFGKNENEISISVADTGIGISKDRADLIFERYVQADSSIEQKYGGTGLGLSISKVLAQKMGGTITVKSEMGRGSTFTLGLPLPAEIRESDNVVSLDRARS